VETVRVDRVELLLESLEELPEKFDDHPELLTWYMWDFIVTSLERILLSSTYSFTKMGFGILRTCSILRKRWRTYA